MLFRSLVSLVVAAIFFLVTPVPPVLAQPEASLDREALPVAGRHTTTFRVPAFGRWSVALESERGVALQLVDKVNGPGEVVGVAGETDGRLDAFLDRGEYKVISHGITGFGAVALDLGSATLTVRPFLEVEERAVTLPDLAAVSTELGDLEQVSWWLQLDTSRRVAFEAAGRHLEDLRLWRDGTWMVGAEPSFEPVEPVVGRPLLIARLAVELPKGLYRLTAYGGVGLRWADDDGSRPLYLRSGVSSRGEAGRSRLAVSEFGIDRFTVPASASFVRLEVPGGDLRGDTVTLEVDDWRLESPYDAGSGSLATVHKELRELAVEQLHNVDEEGRRVITVRAAAGQPYVLQHFRRERVYRFRRAGEYWIDTVHSGHPADAVEATALLFDLKSVDRYETPIRAEVVRLRPDARLARRFNLHQQATLFLEVVAGGSYQVRLDGVDTKVRLEPYVMPGQRLEERPPARRGGSGRALDWDLDPGYYVLTLEPEGQGIADLTISAVGFGEGRVGGGVDPGASPTARLGRVFLKADRSYLLHQNEQPGIRSGVVLRSLPLDLSETLPFVLSGSGDAASLRVPFRVPGGGFLRAVAEDGSELSLRLDAPSAPTPISKTGLPLGSPEGKTVLPVSGSGTVTVRAPDGLALPVAASLFWQPRQQREPLPELPAGVLEALPELPVLTAERERFLELRRSQHATFLVRAEEAALYRLESTGLLDTVGTLRTRVVPELERSDDEGTGRNFLVQRYLGAGEYQLTVHTLGRSAGHLGLRLAAAPVRSAGRLEPGVAARGWIDAAESLDYRFNVPEAGPESTPWHLRVLGLGAVFPVRIEDADGWPITRPGLPGDQVVELEPGEHRLVVLPRAVRSRHVAVVIPVPEPPERDGHGPFDLALGESVEHLWQESSVAFRASMDEDGELPPDRWRLRLSAPVDLRFELSRDVVADVVRLGGANNSGGEEILGRVTSLRGLDDALLAGDYELRVHPARRNNRVEYSLRVEPLQLLPGTRTRVKVPGIFGLRVGAASLVEIASFGSVDVRARLLDDQGRELAQSDDRPGDWNLRLVRRLDPGAYRIEMGTTGEGGSVDLRVSTLEEAARPALDLSAGAARTSLVPGNSVHLFPLEPAPVGGVVMASAESAEGLRLTLEVQSDDANERWRAAADGEGRTARLAYAVADGERMRLRLEAPDRGSSQVELAAVWTATAPVDEARLARGVRMRDILDGRGVVAVSLERPGCFDFARRPPGELRLAGFPGRALRPAPDLAAAGPMLFIEASAGTELRAERWFWPARDESSDGERRRLRSMPDEEATCDLVPSDRVRLLSARGLGGQATLSVGGGGAQAADGAEALALALPRAGTASIAWSTPDEANGDGGSAGDVVLSAWAFAEGPPRPAGDRIAGSLAAGESRLYALPPGPRRLRLTLGAGVSAAVTTGRRVDFLHRAPRGGVEVVRDAHPATASDAYLRLLAPAAGAGLFEVSLLERVGSLPDPSGSTLFERSVERVGVVDFDLPPLALPERLQLRGAERVTLLGADGSVRISDLGDASLTVPAGGGRLVVEHRPGFVIAWLGDEVTDLEAGAALQPSHLEIPSVRLVAWPGAVFGVDFDRPRVLHLRAPTPALVAVTSGTERRVELEAETLSLDTWLPAGPSTLVIRALDGRPFGGELEATASDVVAIGEGLGPEILLRPGGERFASFEVEYAGRVGVAVRADSEVVGLRLLDARGRVLPGSGEGVLHMAELEPGRYLMAMSLTAGHAPVRVRPVVVGLEPPSGPPDEVVQRYLALAAGEVSP